MPPLATKHTRAGAIAFTKHYFAIANYAQEALDVQPLVELADPACNTCDGGTDALQRIARRNGVVRGGTTTLSKLHAHMSEIAGQEWMRVTFKWHVSALQEDYPGTKNDKSWRPTGGSSYFVLKPTDSGWLVDYWDIQ